MCPFYISIIPPVMKCVWWGEGGILELQCLSGHVFGFCTAQPFVMKLGGFCLFLKWFCFSKFHTLKKKKN